MRLAPRILDLGPWVLARYVRPLVRVSSEAQMKLPPIFSALPSNKAHAQSAGGDLGGMGAVHSRCPQDKRPK